MRLRGVLLASVTLALLFSLLFAAGTAAQVPPLHVQLAPIRPLRWLRGRRALRRGARLLRQRRAAAHAPRPQSKHSPLTSSTTTLAGSRAGARCDAARGCCGGGGRRRTRRGPGVSTVYLLPLLPLSLAPELARAATRREAAALAEGVGGACTARRVVLPLLHEGRHAQRPSGARRTEATSTRRTSTAPSRRPRGSTPSTRHSRRPRHCSGRRRPASAAAQRVYPCYDGVAAAEGPSRPLLPIERDLGRGSPSFRDGGLSQRRRRHALHIHHIGCTSLIGEAPVIRTAQRYGRVSGPNSSACLRAETIARRRADLRAELKCMPEGRDKCTPEGRP